MSTHTTPIDRCGLYLTRNGKQVRIYAIHTDGKSSAPCHGHILTIDKLGRVRRKWNIWCLNGNFKFVGTSGLDIVSYVGA